jgi:hypothetical protein
MKLLKTESGFSLVSVLVAIGLTGVLATILMNLSEQQARQQKKAMVDGELTEILTHFRSILSNAESCNATFMNKKKGQEIYRLLTSDDPNRDPFAEVSEEIPFRGSKLLLTKMRLLTNNEINDNEFYKTRGIQAQDGVVVLEASFKKTGQNLGATDIKKHFEFRALYGVQRTVNHPSSETGVVTVCKTKWGQNAFIQDLETGEKAVPEENGVMAQGGEYTGMCVSPNENDPEASIINCITAK